MAATIRLFCAGAVKSAVTGLMKTFEQDTGRRFACFFGTVGALQARVRAGEVADIVILTRPALEELVGQGKVLMDTLTDLGQIGVGIAVRKHAPLPDVSSRESLRASLLAATSVAYGDPDMGDSSGIHFNSVLRQLGIADQIKAKTVLAPIGLAVAELVAQGKAEIGATQASIILAQGGVALAGLLPPSLQHVTTYSAGIVAHGAAFHEAREYLTYLTSPSAQEKFRALGFEHVS